MPDQADDDLYFPPKKRKWKRRLAIALIVLLVMALAGEMFVSSRIASKLRSSVSDKLDAELRSGVVLYVPPYGVVMFEPRLTQVDLRVSRMFRLMGTTRLRGSLDIYNIFNASSVLSMTPTYGQSWRNAAQVLSPRLLRIGAQLDF